MKEYDKVELISDKNKFRELGIEKGRIGTVLGPKRNGYWYVVFEGEILPENFVCPICKHPAEDFEKVE